MKTIALIILDGWGYREETEYNAIAQANTPHWDQLWQTCPHSFIDCSGHAVGLPDNQMGNSEVGHLTMGAGRTIFQELTRIDEAIKNGEFYKNSVLNQVLRVETGLIASHSQRTPKIHILGLLSPGGVHSHENHLYAMATLAAQHGVDFYIHAFLDGRDTPPQSAHLSLQKLAQHLQQLGRGEIASVIGRYYAMDRDKRWERTQKAYDLLTSGVGEFTAESAEQALQQAYERGETDEFVSPTLIVKPQSSPIKIENGDVVIFMNFRADRARQLTRAFVEDPFEGFQRAHHPKLAAFVSITQYAADIPTKIAFPSQSLENVLGAYLSQNHIPQLHLAETEKYAHVTFFFNGGQESPFPLEDRILIPSPKVATYDLKPEMSALEVTDKLVEAILSQQYGFIVCNFANPDMVGHTGNFEATVQAIEAIDYCLGKITQALHQSGGEAIITADHGNAEKMYDPGTHQPHTAHTSELVPCVYVGRKACMLPKGTLVDIAPTILKLMGLPQPKEMQGKSLVNFEN